MRSQSSEARCQLIVNADDFGLTESVNLGVIDAHRRGIVTSTSIMAVGAAFEDAVARARECPRLSVGVHLTLTEEHPVLAGRVGSLVTGQGGFHHHAMTFLQEYIRGHIDLTEVENELDAQIRRVVDAGLAVSHLDGHQHIHALPAIWRVAVRLARRYGIARIRLPRERLRPYALGCVDGPGRLIHQAALSTLTLLLPRQGVVAPEHFFGFSCGGNLTTPNLLRIVASLPRRGTCELMCHPGRQPETSGYQHWQYHWQAELDALTAPEVAQQLAERGVELISYREL